MFDPQLIGMGLSLLAVVWLALREIAPRTQWKGDDYALDVIEGLANQLGVDPDDLASKGRRTRKTHAKVKGAGAKASSPALAVLAAAGLALALAGCASFKAETPAQRVFALKTDYLALLQVAVAYESLPRCAAGQSIETDRCSEPEVVAELRRADNDAKELLDAAERLVRSETAEGDSVRFALEAAAEAVRLLEAVLRNHGLLEVQAAMAGRETAPGQARPRPLGFHPAALPT